MECVYCKFVISCKACIESTRKPRWKMSNYDRDIIKVGPITFLRLTNSRNGKKSTGVLPGDPALLKAWPVFSAILRYGSSSDVI
jgi:hypothetical protein